jgi:hypothetical protein
MMIAMAGHTGFAMDFCRGMVSFIQIDTGFKFRMAFQAFGVRYFITHIMAMGTVG